MFMRRLVLVYLLIITISLFSNHNFVESLINHSAPLAITSINSINITLFYNLWESYGFITYTVFLTNVEENYTFIDIPLISDNVSYITVYDDNGKPLVFNFYEVNAEKWIEVMVSNTSRVVVTYVLESVFEEVSIGTYTALVNLTRLMNYTFTLVIEIDGVFDTIVVPSPYSVRVVGETTEIILTEPNEYSITLLSLYTPPTPATTTPTVTPTVTTTTTTQTVSESNTMVSVGGAKESEGRGMGGVAGLVIIGILVLIAVVAYIMIRRK